MTTYTVVVNGKTYEVEVEKKGSSAAVQKSVPVANPVTAPAPAVKAPVRPTAADGATNALTAPMPGKIIKVNVVVGDHVTKGQELIIMEAMKMHNPVLASNAGVVKKIYVKVGDPVQTGTLLIEIE